MKYHQIQKTEVANTKAFLWCGKENFTAKYVNGKEPEANIELNKLYWIPEYYWVHILLDNTRVV